MSNGKLLGFKDLMKAKELREFNKQDENNNPAQQGQPPQQSQHAEQSQQGLPLLKQNLSNIETNDFPTAPVKNFQKVTNTITQQAIPKGLFRQGKSKQIYDVLYSLTRGAIKPTRIVRISKPRLRQLSGVNTRATMDAGLAHLRLVRLITINETSGGQHTGHEYEVFLPEEIIDPAEQGQHPQQGQHAEQPLQGQHPEHPQKVTMLSRAESNHAKQGLNPINIEAESSSKTFFNTIEERTDDERSRAAFGELESILNKTVKDLTGRESTEADREKWKHVGEILAVQLELIASRTTISNAPAVLAEHLHRHLNNKRVQEKLGLITPAEAKEAKETSKSQKQTTERELIPDLYLCPDCFGTMFWNPDGKGKRRGCTHPRLEEARQRAKENGEI